MGEADSSALAAAVDIHFRITYILEYIIVYKNMRVAK